MMTLFDDAQIKIKRTGELEIMKKKNLLICLIAMLSMGSMAACGKEEPAVTSEAESETDIVIRLEGEIQGIKLSDGKAQEQMETSEKEGTETPNSNDKKFECFPEIEEASVDSGKLQIDDMLFTIGAPVQEIFDALENSECEYEYDYTPEALIAKEESDQLIFKKNGKDYIFLYVYNDTDATCELKDCVITAAKALTNEASVYYAGNIAVGGSYDDITGKLANCENVEEYSNSIKQEYIVTYKITTLDEIYYGTAMEIHDGFILELTFDSNTRILKYLYVSA